MAVIETIAYSIKPADVQWLVPQAEELLSRDEYQRWQRFRVAQARDTFIASRYLLRTSLARRLACAPADIQLGRAEHGKPFIDKPACSWQFNLSHSRDCVLLAIADGIELGVDVEQRKATLPLAELAERVLTAQELAQFEVLSEASQVDYFFRAWVLKESYLKLRGTGIWHGLNSLTTDLHAPAYPDDRSVQARYLRVPSSFTAALAYRGAQAGAVAVEQIWLDSLQDSPSRR